MAKYQDYLMDNEEVVWEGKAQKFPLLDAANKISLLLTWTICAVGLILLVAVYMPYTSSRSIEGANIIITCVVVVSLVGICGLRPVVDKKTLESKVTYVLTNYRALVIHGDTVNSMFIDKKTKCRLEILDKNSGIIFIGSACKTNTRKSRVNTLVGIKSKSGGQIDGLVFYNVADPTGVCELYTPFSYEVNGKTVTPKRQYVSAK